MTAMQDIASTCMSAAIFLTSTVLTADLLAWTPGVGHDTANLQASKLIALAQAAQGSRLQHIAHVQNGAHGHDQVQLHMRAVICR